MQRKSLHDTSHPDYQAGYAKGTQALRAWYIARNLGSFKKTTRTQFRNWQLESILRIRCEELFNDVAFSQGFVRGYNAAFDRQQVKSPLRGTEAK